MVGDVTLSGAVVAAGARGIVVVCAGGAVMAGVGVVLGVVVRVTCGANGGRGTAVPPASGHGP